MCVGKGSPLGEKEEKRGMVLWGEDNLQLSNKYLYFICIYSIDRKQTSHHDFLITNRTDWARKSRQRIFNTMIRLSHRIGSLPWRVVLGIMFTVRLQFLNGAPFFVLGFKALEFFLSVRRGSDIGYYPVPGFPHLSSRTEYLYSADSFEIRLLPNLWQKLSLLSASCFVLFSFFVGFILLASCSKRQSYSSAIWGKNIVRWVHLSFGQQK